MKKLLVPVALALLAATPVFAAIQYEFTQRNTTSDSISPSNDLIGRATIDGARSRIEFLGGTLYPPGTYVVSTDASRRLYFVDPSKQWYTEVNTASVATAIGTSNIKIENFKTSSETLPDKTVIAGLETVHQRITMSYDITLITRAMPLKLHVRSEIDAWTTDRFGSLLGAGSYFSSSMRTGNPEVDQIIAAGEAKIEGLPLRQIVVTRTNYQRATGSQLQAANTRTVTREMWVTSVKETEAPAALFTLPATYRRADQPELPKAATQVLTFEPATK